MPEPLEIAAAEFCRAACTGQLEEADALLSRHPELVRRSIHCAAVLGDVDGLEVLLAGDPAQVDAPIGGSWSPLLLLAFSHYGRGETPRAAALVRCAETLLAKGAHADAGLADDELPGGRVTALAAAAGVSANRELCEVLLRAGAEPNDGAALFMAAANEHWDCAVTLVRAGADWNATDRDGRFAPLHWLLDRRFVHAAVEELLQRGADPNRRVGQQGETALHVAVRRHRLEILDSLLRAGAAIDARTRGGVTAYRHARRRGFAAIAAKLAASGADTTTTRSDAIALALLDGDVEGARDILRAHPTALRSPVPEEARLLGDLAGRGAVAAVEWLLDAGFEITARGLDGGTPLHQAAWFGQPAVAKLLIQRGAPLDSRGDDHDCTPLGWAAHGSSHSDAAATRGASYVEVAALLLEAGAPLPRADESHDHVQLAAATDEVKSVLRRFGWAG